MSTSFCKPYLSFVLCLYSTRSFSQIKIDTADIPGYYVSVFEKNENSPFESGFFSDSLFWEKHDEIFKNGTGNSMRNYNTIDIFALLRSSTMASDINYCYFDRNPVLPTKVDTSLNSNLPGVSTFYRHKRNKSVRFSISKRTYKYLIVRNQLQCPYLCFCLGYEANTQTMKKVVTLLVPIKLLSADDNIKDYKKWGLKVKR